jgi:hypothetical protein
MIDPDTPDSKPSPAGLSAAAVILLILGVLLLTPGICAVIFIPEYVTSPSPVPDSIKQAWIISFIISTGGIALIVYAFRK